MRGEATGQSYRSAAARRDTDARLSSCYLFCYDILCACVCHVRFSNVDIDREFSLEIFVNLVTLNITIKAYTRDSEAGTTLFDKVLILSISMYAYEDKYRYLFVVCRADY